MVTREDMGSWLSGTSGAGRRRLELPASGPGSLASPGRRVIALGVDWLICSLINYLVFDARAGRSLLDINGMVTLGLFAVENVLLVATLGFTLGHQLVGIRVARLDGRRLVGVVPAVIRTVLLCLVIPAVVWDSDKRGLHDKAAGTIIVRM